MARRWTKSIDGESRTTLLVRKRVTGEELERLEAIAKHQGRSVHELLGLCLEAGLDIEDEQYDEEMRHAEWEASRSGAAAENDGTIWR